MCVSTEQEIFKKLHRQFRGIKKDIEDQPTVPLSVVILVFISHIRPHVLVTGRVPDIIITGP
jgi:hypothetical protein